MSKRQAIGKRPRAAPRPIDKELKVVNQTSTTSVTTTVLKTTTFPCTIVGLRWNMSSTSITANNTLLQWAIVLVQDGDSVNTPASSDGADFYTPEQNVLAFGVSRLMANNATGGNISWNWEGSTKTMRKMKQGDVLNFITLSDTANSISLDGIVQFFCKS